MPTQSGFCLRQNNRSISDGGQHVYKFQVPNQATGNKAFKVTMTWFDPYTASTAGKYPPPLAL
jgi:hypothetical protein